jgi:hypothetical protein
MQVRADSRKIKNRISGILKLVHKGRSSESMKHPNLLTGSIKTHLIVAVVSVLFAELLLLGAFLAYAPLGWVAAWAGASLVAVAGNGLTVFVLGRSFAERTRRLREVAAAKIKVREPDPKVQTTDGDGPGEPDDPPETDAPPVVDVGRLKENGFAAKLRDLVEEWRRGKAISMTVDILADPEIGGNAAEVSLLRVAREALDNVGRHSHAANAIFRLEADSQEIRMTVADDGAGFDPAIQESTAGSGLSGMRDWMREADGLLLVQTAPDRGTTIQAILPLPTAQNPSAEEEPKQ